MSVSGNQRTQPNQVSNVTLDPIVSPVTTDAMGEFLGLGLPLSASDSAIIEGLLLASCEYYIAYYNNELLSRNYTLKANHHTRRQEAYGGLGQIPSLLDWWISFPIYPVSLINSVTIDDALTTEYTENLSVKPSTIELVDTIFDGLVIEYAAGYPDVDSIPKNVITGIQLMTAYMYEHRGACDAGAAAKESGAELMWANTKMILSL